MNGFEMLLRRERWIIAFGLAVICVLSWAYVASGAGTGMNSGAMIAVGIHLLTLGS